MRSKHLWVKLIFCLLEWLRLWTLSNNRSLCMSGESPRVWLDEEIHRLGPQLSRQEGVHYHVNPRLGLSPRLLQCPTQCWNSKSRASWFTSWEISVLGKQKLAIEKSSPWSPLAKVIETLLLTFDCFDGSGFKEFRWEAFGSLLALRSCSKPAYQLWTEQLQLLALGNVPRKGRPFEAGFL